MYFDFRRTGLRIGSLAILVLMTITTGCSQDPTPGPQPGADGGADAAHTDMQADVATDAGTVDLGQDVSMDAADAQADDMGQAPVRRVEIREWRLDGPGPGIDGRAVVRFQSAYHDPVEAVRTDAEGVAEIAAEGPLHVAVEAPHGRSFYAIPSLPENMTLLVAHPDYPGPEQTETLQVALDSAGTVYESGTLTVGSRRTAQPFDVADSSEATIELERRNLHTDGTVSIVGILRTGGQATARLGLHRATSDVVLDRELQGFRVAVDTGQADVAATRTSVYGVIDGAELPLGDSSRSVAFLPMQNELLDEMVFDAFVLEVQGTVTGAMGESNWSMRRRLAPAELAQMVDAATNNLLVSLDLPSPVFVSTNDADTGLLRVTSVEPGSSPGHPRTELWTTPVGDDAVPSLVALHLPEPDDEMMVHGTSPGGEWIDRTTASADGTSDGTPHVRVIDLAGGADFDEQQLSLTWTIDSDSCDSSLSVDYRATMVSDWYAPFAGASTGDCSAFQANDDTPVDQQRTVSAATMAADTSSVVSPDGAWLLPSDSEDPAPARGASHEGTVFTEQLPPDTPWAIVLDTAISRLDGGLLRLVPADVTDPDLEPWAVRTIQTESQRTDLTVTWESN